MGIAASELCRYVIRPTLLYLGRHNPTAESLLLGIAASQSALGSALHDRRGHGLYSITEPPTSALLCCARILNRCTASGPLTFCGSVMVKVTP